MTESLTTNVYYQNTVREYSGNIVHQLTPEIRKELYNAKEFRFTEKDCYSQEHHMLSYRTFTHKIFKDSNVLNEAWCGFNIPNITPYRYIRYFTGEHSNNTTLRRIAERIILELASQKTAKKILLGIFKKEPQIYYHSIEVMCLTISMAQCLEYDENSIYEIGMAAALHDIGKVLLPCELLHLLQEPDNIHKHRLQKIPSISTSMAKKAGFTSSDILNGILAHQENHIGTGFPFAKMQQEIHPYGMLIHVADDYETIAFEKKDSAYAKNYIRKMTCRRYSFFAVNAFNDIL